MEAVGSSYHRALRYATHPASEGLLTPHRRLPCEMLGPFVYLDICSLTDLNARSFADRLPVAPVFPKRLQTCALRCLLRLNRSNLEQHANNKKHGERPCSCVTPPQERSVVSRTLRAGTLRAQSPQTRPRTRGSRFRHQGRTSSIHSEKAGP